MITQSDDLKSACQRLAQERVVAVDTEFLRDNTFWPKLCVVQLAGVDGPILVDALAEDINLTPFLDLMRNPHVVKVFHAGRQDIEIVHHLSGFVPTPIFDTQIAAAVLGLGDAISYDHLVSRLIGATIDKTSRFTDWARRPLSAQQLAYAAADVEHLLSVYEKLKEMLTRFGREAWVADEIATLISPETYRTDPKRAWERLKLRLRRPIELAVVRELAEWRENEAMRRNVPRSRILKDDALFEIAMQRPRSIEDLKQLRTLQRQFSKGDAAGGILAAVERAFHIPQKALPRPPRRRRNPEGVGAAVDLLKVLLKLVSERESVAPRVIATSEDLEMIAINETANVRALTGWRRSIFGEAALRLKRGELALAFNGRSVVALDTESSSEQVVNPQSRGANGKKINRTSQEAHGSANAVER